jgi:hypothetical protein
MKYAGLHAKCYVKYAGLQSLVIAGLGDLARPAEKISILQSAALSATGLVWARYSMVIIPKNYSLFSVNVFVAITGLYSLGRAIKYVHIVELSEMKNSLLWDITSCTPAEVH